MFRLIILGQYEVDGGQKGDPKRVAKLVRNCPYWLGDGGLEPDRFSNIDSWPEGRCQLKLAVICFPGEVFSNLAEAQARLKGEPKLADWQLGGFPELMSDGLWEHLQTLWEQDVYCVVAPADSAVWLTSDGDRYVLYVYCYPTGSRLHACLVEYELDGRHGLLVSRKVRGV